MYNSVIDKFSLEQWQEYCSKFSAMNIYQTGLYGELHSKALFRSCSRVAVFKNSSVKALAQLRIKYIPFLKTGVAEIDWGPIWHWKPDNIEDEAFHILLNTLKEEYCYKRNLEIRMRPCNKLLEDNGAKLNKILTEHGFKKTEVRPYHTVIIDLDNSLETIRANLHAKWRNHLCKAEKANLMVKIGNSLEYYDRFYTLYKKMWHKKRFPSGVRFPIIRKLQKYLSEDTKFLVLLIMENDTDIGAHVCSAIGDTMLSYVAASDPEKRVNNPGYLFHWQAIVKAKELGFRWYDVGGYDDNVSALASFKKRTNGSQVIFPGQFEALPGQEPSKVYIFMEKSFHKIRRIATGR